MGIETKYDYIYYTILNLETINEFQREIRDNTNVIIERNELIEIASVAIDNQFKNSKDKTINNHRVDYCKYCDNIKHWISCHLRHKECPVFVQIQDTQPIQLTGSGCLFVLYNIEDEDEESNENTTSLSEPDSNNNNNHDGLVGLRGRL